MRTVHTMPPQTPQPSARTTALSQSSAMLSARKVQLLAGLKVHGLELRNKELDFYMIRFAMTAGLSSIMTCLSYVGLIKIKIPEPMHEGFYWQVATFYVCTSLSMVLSLYNLVLTSFSMVQGQASRRPGLAARAGLRG